MHARMMETMWDRQKWVLNGGEVQKTDTFLA
jgi:hypothetical protein